MRANLFLVIRQDQGKLKLRKNEVIIESWTWATTWLEYYDQMGIQDWGSFKYATWFAFVIK